MAARRKPITPDQKFNALYDALSGISRLFGGSTVSGDENTIRIEIPGQTPAVYAIGADGSVLVAQNVGTTKRPKMEMRPTMIEEPLALLLEYTAPNDGFNDAYGNVVDYAARYARMQRFV